MESLVWKNQARKRHHVFEFQYVIVLELQFDLGRLFVVYTDRRLPFAGAYSVRAF